MTGYQLKTGKQPVLEEIKNLSKNIVSFTGNTVYASAAPIRLKMILNLLGTDANSSLWLVAIRQQRYVISKKACMSYTSKTVKLRYTYTVLKTRTQPANVTESETNTMTVNEMNLCGMVQILSLRRFRQPDLYNFISSSSVNSKQFHLRPVLVFATRTLPTGLANFSLFFKLYASTHIS